MLNDNIKSLRKANGLSQEELATKLNVVRQTVSKWEKGLSVPDAEMLLHLAEALDTTVAELLSAKVEPNTPSELKIIASKLEMINEQIIKQNESRRKVWRTLFITATVLAGMVLLGSLGIFLHQQFALQGLHGDAAIIGGADGPTAIFVTNTNFHPMPSVLALLVAILSIIGICKTRKKL